MNLVEKLLAVEETLINQNDTGTVEIKRLSKLTGEPFLVTVKALSGNRFTELSAKMLDANNNADFSKIYTAQTFTVCEGVIEPDLKNKDLMKHFNCTTPKELAEVLFKGGDMAKVYDKIAEISGYGDGSDEKIKN